MKTIIKNRTGKTINLLLIVFTGFIFCECRQHINYYENDAWMNEIQESGPRLFFNKATFPSVKEKALTEESAILEDMKKRIDQLSGNSIEITDPLASNRGWTLSANDAYGTRAAEAAFLFLIYEDEKYLNLSKEILTKVIDLYQIRNKDTLSISWYNNHRMMALAAYDWIYKDRKSVV